jgi:hypothetical protein
LHHSEQEESTVAVMVRQARSKRTTIILAVRAQDRLLLWRQEMLVDLIRLIRKITPILSLKTLRYIRHSNNCSLSCKSSTRYTNNNSSLSSYLNNSNSHKMLDSPVLFHHLPNSNNNKVMLLTILVALTPHSLEHPHPFLNSSSLKNSCKLLSSLNLTHNKNRNHLH